VLIGSLRRRPRDVAWLAAWSAVQALPAAASGWVLAEAAGMFLADRVAEAIGWLGLLAAAAAASASVPGGPTSGSPPSSNRSATNWSSSSSRARWPARWIPPGRRIPTRWRG
jgi:hypothetical protein